MTGKLQDDRKIVRMTENCRMTGNYQDDRKIVRMTRNCQDDRNIAG
jgi:hypothetical protein